MKQKTLVAIRRIHAVLLLAAMLATPLVQLHGPVEARSRTTATVQQYSSTPSKDAVKWAEKQLKKMSLEEKVGQLISVGVNATFLNQDSEAFKALRHQVEDNHIGGIILFRGPVYESLVLMNRMTQVARYAP